jgi:hypothetical protein
MVSSKDFTSSSSVLKHTLLYGMLKGFYKVFISFEVTALAIAALNQVVSGCKTAV